MTPEKELALEEYLNAISEILYEETDSNDLNDNDLNDIEKIEIAVRDKILSHVSPKIFSFFIEKKTGTNKGRKRTLKSPLGKISITEEQSKYLNIKKSTQLSPLLKKCCLRISANVSYQNTAKDIEYLTGIYVSAKTQQRLVQGTEFKRAEAEDEIKELSVDGGKIRLRTPIGKPCEWRDYKAICLNTEVNAAYFQENQTLIDWVNKQSLGNPFTCLGDGHDGIWNIISKFGKTEQRLEILDWFHLKENLYKVGGSLKRLTQAESLLWIGKIAETKQLFIHRSGKAAKNFLAYLSKHETRIVDYNYYSSNKICSIGSGAVESTVKQISRRIKISGAQWKKENVSQVLYHRCAYLNNLI